MDDLERYLSCARADGNIEAMFAFRTAISHLQRKEADSAEWWEHQGIEALVAPSPLPGDKDLCRSDH
jgi:hypothetical protein